MAERVVVVGLGITGRAVCRLLAAEGCDVVVVEDNRKPDTDLVVAQLGVDMLGLDEALDDAALVVPSPGVPASHPVFEKAAATDVPVVSEIELAWQRAPMPLVAVTGTNGKTTVTTLVTEMLVESGLRALAGGNIGLPLVDAVRHEVDVVVAEVSSFQLQHTDGFRPAVAVWLNLADDHRDWHPTPGHYAAAKARIWANQQDGDLAVVNAEDAVVLAAARASAPGRVETFGDSGDWRIEDDWLVGPAGRVVEVSALPRALPHDVANSLAATAAAVGAGAEIDACRRVLARFQGLPHRVELVGDAGGVRFYDDSKATTPASVLAAVGGFPSVVLVAGGRNKGLDLGVLREAAPRVRAVVAIGDAASEVEKAFAGVVPVTVATSMDDAVRLARGVAQPGDAVLLSPGCASYDWYGNYAERGDDFQRAVREQAGTAPDGVGAPSGARRRGWGPAGEKGRA